VLLSGTGRTGVGQTVRLTRIARLLRRVAGDRITATVATGVPRARDLFGAPDYGIAQLDTPGRLTRWGQRGAFEDDQSTLARELLEVIDRVEPHVFVTPHHAGIGGELPKVYAELRRRGVRVVLSLRDQYDAEDFADRDLLVDHLRRYIDEVIVWALPGATQGIPDEILSSRHAPVTFLGFVGPPSGVDGGPPDPDTHRVVTCQVGGGIDGLPVLLAAAAAARRARALGCDLELRLIAGPLTPPADVAALAGGLGRADAISTWRFRDSPARRSSERLRISMAGYNTCVETACDGVPALLLPRSRHGDREQARRAAWFAGNFANISTAAEVDPDAMAEAIVARLLLSVEAGVSALPIDIRADPRLSCRKLLGEDLSMAFDL